MATINFSNIPEVFYNNQRQKYVYLNDEIVWPYEEYTGGEYRFEEISPADLAEGDVVLIVFDLKRFYVYSKYRWNIFG